MKKIVLLLVFICSIFKGSAQSLYFPPVIGNTWDTISPAALGWCQPQIDSLTQFLGNRNTKAFLVLKDGKIVIEKYYGTFTADSLWYWASAGKTLTAFAVGIAQQEGHLSISDTTSDYLGSGWTACTTNQEEKITIRDQLTMTSGLDDGVPDYSCTLDTCLQYLADAGTRWAYHNGPYTLLDSVIEVATGMTLNQYITQKIKMQTGMNGFYFKIAYNNIYFSTPRSMARFGLLLLNCGKWNTTQVLSDTSYFIQMITPSQSLNLSYGYLTWLNGQSSFMVPVSQFVFPGSLSPAAPADMFSAIGKNGQFIDVVPSQNIVVIRMGDAPGTTIDVPFLFNDTIWQKLNSAMCILQTVPRIETEENRFSVFPNPAADHINIQFTGNRAQLIVLDCAGRVVMQRMLNQQQTDLSIENLPTGVYAVQLFPESGLPVKSQRLVIAR